jgi:cytochrome c553
MRSAIASLAMLAATHSPAAQRVPPRDVAVLAATCATCHGPNGQPPDGGASIPGLRGRDAAFLLQRMRAFKAAGHGPDAGATIMPLLLRGYDDAQIEALARWFGRREAP